MSPIKTPPLIEGHNLPSILNTLLIITPATVEFAWLFYRFSEKPFMSKAVRKVGRAEGYRTEEPTRVFAQSITTVPEEA